MRTVLLASLRTHTRRYVAALVAVTIAVAFVVVINALGSSARSAVAAAVEGSYPETALVVGDSYGTAADDDVAHTVEIARERGDRTSVIATTWTRVTAPSGSLGDEVQVGTVSTDPALRTQQVTDGRAPTSDREALVDAGAARAEGIELGDRVTIGLQDRARDFTVVGLTDEGSMGLGDFQVPWPALSSATDAVPDAIAYDVRTGDVDEAQAALADVVESEVQTRDDYVAARIVAMNQGADVLATLLLLFAAVAGFVAILVIANTFTILFAQRSRDFALLRCVGATRRQVLRSVRVEAIVLAVVAATTGIIVGLGGGVALTALLRALAGDEVFGAVSFSPVWLTAAFVGGVLTTVVAAWLPTRGVVRVSPLTALRPAEQPNARTTAGRIRLGIGALAVLAGLAALVLAVQTESMAPLLVGGMVSFIGVLLLGPVLVPAMLRLLGRITGRFGGPFRV
ncbi:ABC transporter permease, partial [Aeromicrobium sp.]|uniref:ABC transporter permease n=1 Tax=Aeromicrobium sp. TaxID=1871063 RepID=UPI0028ACD5D1